MLASLASPVTETQTERIQQIIAELEQTVPKDNARVHLSQYGGGPDESRVAATREGYLRLGIEFLRAAFAPPCPKAPDLLDVDLDYLVTEDSDIHFDWFERRTELPTPAFSASTGSRFLPLLSAAIGTAALLLIVIGLRTVIKWLF